MQFVLYFQKMTSIGRNTSQITVQYGKVIDLFTFGKLFTCLFILYYEYIFF